MRRWLAAGLAALGVWLHAGPAAVAAEPDYRAALAASQAAIGQAVGEHPMRDTQGRPVRFAELKGRPLVVNFVYTGCFQACPVATQFLAGAVRTARAALGERSFSVVTIGFNQPFDSPVAMADFARRNRIADPDWHFLSPDPSDVEALTKAFGFAFQATPKGFDHIAQVTVVDAEGVVYRQIYGETFELPMLVGPLKELLSGQADRRLTLGDVWTKVKLYCTVYDANSGGYRLNYSLFFELFAGITFLAAVAAYLVIERRRAARAAVPPAI
jgi:protein SCO1/2